MRVVRDNGTLRIDARNRLRNDEPVGLGRGFETALCGHVLRSVDEQPNQTLAVERLHGPRVGRTREIEDRGEYILGIDRRIDPHAFGRTAFPAEHHRHAHTTFIARALALAQRRVLRVYII